MPFHSYGSGLCIPIVPTLSKVRVCCLLQALIRVIDTNNHRPQFSEAFYEVNVAEDEPPGTEVLQISASDRDEKNKLTFTLLSSTDPFSLRKFRLDPGTGTLFTAERLDHETMHRHVLTVMVGAIPDACTGTIGMD